MSYYKPRDVERLELPSNPEFWVTMRRATWADVKAAQSAVVRIRNVDVETVDPSRQNEVQRDQEDPDSRRGFLTDVDANVYDRAAMLRLITSWNLTDAEEQIRPVTEDALDELEPEDGQFLAKEARMRLRGRITRERPFEKASKPSWPVMDPPMLGSSTHSSGFSSVSDSRSGPPSE